MNSTEGRPSEASPSDFVVALPPLWMRVIATCICVPITVFGGIGNVTILLAFALNRKTLWKKQNIYLFCLTITDLITATLATSVTLDQYLLGRWRYSHGLCRAFQATVAVNFGSSFTFIALIARDRMLMVTKGAAYDAYETTRRKWLYAWINIIGQAIFSLPFHSYDIFSGFSIFVPNGLCNPEELQNLYVTIATQFTFTQLPCIFMLYYYARVRQYFRKRRKIGAAPAPQVAAGQGAGGTTTTGTSQQPSATVTVVTAVTVTAANPAADKSQRADKIMNVLLVSAIQCCIPSTSLGILMNILIANPTLVTFETFIWWSNLYSIAFMWAFGANAVNPYLYAYAMPSFQEAARNVGGTILNLFKKN